MLSVGGCWEESGCCAVLGSAAKCHGKRVCCEGWEGGVSVRCLC